LRFPPGLPPFTRRASVLGVAPQQAASDREGGREIDRRAAEPGDDGSAERARVPGGPEAEVEDVEDDERDPLDGRKSAYWLAIAFVCALGAWCILRVRRECLRQDRLSPPSAIRVQSSSSQGLGCLSERAAAERQRWATRWKRCRVRQWYRASSGPSSECSTASTESRACMPSTTAA
jgi:hypothetical protein